MALDATVGGPDSNSYVTLTEANTYFTNHYSSVKRAAWAAVTVDAQKESVLLRACQQLETLRMLDDELSTGRLPVALVETMGYDLSVHRAEIGQRLQLPRNLDVDVSDVVFVPQEAKDAQCEQAVFLLSFDDSAILAMGQGVVEEAITAGPVRSYVRYSEGRAPSYLSPMAIELMRPFLRVSSRLSRA